jgi:hypothetical protein
MEVLPFEESPIALGAGQSNVGGIEDFDEPQDEDFSLILQKIEQVKNSPDRKSKFLNNTAGITFTKA